MIRVKGICGLFRRKWICRFVRGMRLLKCSRSREGRLAICLAVICIACCPNCCRLLFGFLDHYHSLRKYSLIQVYQPYIYCLFTTSRHTLLLLQECLRQTLCDKYPTNYSLLYNVSLKAMKNVHKDG